MTLHTRARQPYSDLANKTVETLKTTNNVPIIHSKQSFLQNPKTLGRRPSEIIEAEKRFFPVNDGIVCIKWEPLRAANRLFV